MDKSQGSIEKDMIKFVRDLQASGNTSRIGRGWPSLVPETVVGKNHNCFDKIFHTKLFRLNNTISVVWWCQVWSDHV